VELALATRIPVREWMQESDETVATVLDVFEERAREAKRKRKR
jgi:hypothetical protein